MLNLNRLLLALSFFLLICFSKSFNAIGQCVCSNCLSIPTYSVDDVCPGATVNLHPTVVGLDPDPTLPVTYTWTGPGSISTPNALTTDVTLPAIAGPSTYNLTVTGWCSNIVPNGDFEAGGPDFYYAPCCYTYGTSTTGSVVVTNIPPALTGPFSYCNLPSYPAGAADHTSYGPGNYLLVDGATSGTTNVPFWRKQLYICSNTTYTFSIWVSVFDIQFSGGPIIKVRLGNVITPLQWTPGPFNTCDASWHQYTGTFTSGSTPGIDCGNIDLSISDENKAGYANDFAVDDISLKRQSTVSTSVTVTPDHSPIIDAITTTCLCSGITESLTVTGATGDVVKVKIHSGSISGSVVWSTPGTGYTIPTGGTGNITILPSLAPGTYVAEITEVKPSGCPVFVPVSIPQTFTVYPSGGAGTVNGQTTICKGSTATFTCSLLPTFTGLWTSSNTSVAQVNSSTGVVQGIGAGTAIISFTTTSACCGSNTTTLSVTVLNTDPGVIGGPSHNVCVNNDLALTETVSGGVWTASNSHATVNSSGVVHGVSVGAVTITYTVTGPPPTNCVNYTTYDVNVITTPAAPIITSALPCPSVCVGGTANFTGTPGGTSTYPPTWTVTGAASLASSTYTFPSSTAVVAGGSTVGAGLILYTVQNECGSNSTPMKITVVDNPVVEVHDENGGTSGTMCQEWAVSLYYSPAGGLWSTSDATVAYVSGLGGIVAVGPGTAILTYTYTSPTCPNCVGTATYTITVYPTPVASITSDPAGYGSPLTVMSCGDPINLYATTSVTSPDVITEINWWAASGGLAGTGSSISVTPPFYPYTYTLGVATNHKCVANATVTVIKSQAPCVCSYGAGSAPFSPFGASGTVTGGTYSGNFVLNNDVVINGTVTLNNCVIAIAAGKTIKVSPNAKLIINGSHLFCCAPDMWQGIVLLSSGTTPSGKLELLNNTLIEDAAIGVSIPNPVAIASYLPGSSTTNLILYSHGATFNKNTVGIQVSNYNAIYTYSSDIIFNPSYPFHVENTVFTSRQLNGYTTGGTPATTWPMVWPAASGTSTAFKASWASGNPYSPNYYIDRPGVYPATTCNNGSNAFAGIFLTNVGNVVASGDPGTEQYSLFTNGAIPTTGNAQLNMFDHLQYGIRAENSSLLSRNSVFMHIGFVSRQYAPNGHGISFISDALVQRKLNVYGQSATSNNSFYDCSQAVYAVNPYYLYGTQSRIYSNHQSTVLGDGQGRYGYNVQGYRYYMIKTTNNWINNIHTGINIITTTAPVGSLGSMIGQITVTGNNIQATTGGTAPTTTYKEYVYRAVVVQGLPMGGGDNIVPGAQVNVNSNQLKYVYNGIYLQGPYAQQFVMTSSYNNIILTPDNTALPAYTQTGISHNSTMYGYTVSNNINGPGYLTPVPACYGTTLPYTTAGRLIEGIYMFNAINQQLECNQVTDVNTGFHFKGTNSGMDWIGNSMTRNAYGMVLDGDISSQPAGSGLTTGNKWMTTTGSGWSSWAAPNRQTYVVTGATAAGSPMNVLSGVSMQIPTNNYAEVPGMQYQSPTSIIISSLGNATCGTSPTGIPLMRNGHIQTAQKQLFYNTDVHVKQKNWIAQKALWDALKDDTTATDSSAVLQSFWNMGQSSRYQYLNSINSNIVQMNYGLAHAQLAAPLDTLATSDSDAVTGAIMADDVDADNVVYNYKKYYELLLRYMEDTLTTTDSVYLRHLAEKCPDVDGAVVYNARALYSLVFNDMQIFNDGGCGAVEMPPAERNAGATGVKDINSITGQQYNLYPNPSDGHIILMQTKTDNRDILAEVLTATGTSILRQQLHFEDRQAAINVTKAPPGIYILILADGDGTRYTLKFVKE